MFDQYFDDDENMYNGIDFSSDNNIEMWPEDNRELTQDDIVPPDKEKNREIDKNTDNELKINTEQNNMINPTQTPNQAVDFVNQSYIPNEQPSFQPCTQNARFDNFQYVTSNPNSGKDIFPLINRVAPDSEGYIMFKEGVYHTFTKKKKFDKKYLRIIHSELQARFGFQKMRRYEYRSIDRYFQHYLPKRDEIICFLASEKEKLIQKYPELGRL